MIDHFSLLAPFYDRLFTHEGDTFLVELADLPEQGRLLDAGGGTGRIARTLARPGLQIVVADSSFAMSCQAVRKGLATACACTERLPFAEGTFARIVMVDALHHVHDQRRTAEELWRVLQPGGRIVIVEPDIERPLVWALALFEKLALMRSHFLRLSQVLALFPVDGATASGQRRGYNFGAVIKKVK